MKKGKKAKTVFSNSRNTTVRGMETGKSKSEEKRKLLFGGGGKGKGRGTCHTARNQIETLRSLPLRWSPGPPPYIDPPAAFRVPADLNEMTVPQICLHIFRLWNRPPLPHRCTGPQHSPSPPTSERNWRPPDMDFFQSAPLDTGKFYVPVFNTISQNQLSSPESLSAKMPILFLKERGCSLRGPFPLES